MPSGCGQLLNKSGALSVVIPVAGIVLLTQPNPEHSMRTREQRAKDPSADQINSAFRSTSVENRRRPVGHDVNHVTKSIGADIERVRSNNHTFRSVSAARKILRSLLPNVQPVLRIPDGSETNRSDQEILLAMKMPAATIKKPRISVASI
jgi:hypothetical protein